MPTECVDQIWNTTNEVFNVTELIWNQCLPVVTIGGPGGGLKRWFKYKHLKPEQKKQIVRVVLYLQGSEYIDEHVIENYKVKIGDLKMLRKKYLKYKKNLAVKVEDIVIK